MSGAGSEHRVGVARRLLVAPRGVRAAAPRVRRGGAPGVARGAREVAAGAARVHDVRPGAVEVHVQTDRVAAVARVRAVAVHPADGGAETTRGPTRPRRGGRSPPAPTRPTRPGPPPGRSSPRAGRSGSARGARGRRPSGGSGRGEEIAGGRPGRRRRVGGWDGCAAPPAGSHGAPRWCPPPTGGCLPCAPAGRPALFSSPLTRSGKR